MASAVQKFVSKPLDIKAYGTRPRQGKEHIRDLLYDCAVHLAAGNDRDTKLLVNDFCQYFMEEPAAPDSDGELTSEETVVRNVIEAFNACGQKDKDHALRRAYLQLVVLGLRVSRRPGVFGGLHGRAQVSMLAQGSSIHIGSRLRSHIGSRLKYPCWLVPYEKGPSDPDRRKQMALGP